MAAGTATLQLKPLPTVDPTPPAFLPPPLANDAGKSSRLSLGIHCCIFFPLLVRPFITCDENLNSLSSGSRPTLRSSFSSSPTPLAVFNQTHSAPESLHRTRTCHCLKPPSTIVVIFSRHHSSNEEVRSDGIFVKGGLAVRAGG
jgi:hypothetical protein